MLQEDIDQRERVRTRTSGVMIDVTEAYDILRERIFGFSCYNMDLFLGAYFGFSQAVKRKLHNKPNTITDQEIEHILMGSLGVDVSSLLTDLRCWIPTRWRKNLYPPPSEKEWARFFKAKKNLEELFEQANDAIDGLAVSFYGDPEEIFSQFEFGAGRRAREFSRRLRANKRHEADYE